MQVPVVMMLALAGLGCQNKTSGWDGPIDVIRYQAESPALPSEQAGGYAAGRSHPSFAATPYPATTSRLCPRYSQPHSGDWHVELRSTLYSFVCGHDPDVSTAPEIEASVYGAEFPE